VLGNLINRHDAVRLYRRLRRGKVRELAAKVRTPGPERVLATWSAPGHGAGQVQWDGIPAIRRRWHTFGGGEASFAEHVSARWLSGRAGLRALSLGCGAGDQEMEWARLGVFTQITGVDISPEQTERATRRAKEAGLDDTLGFHVADARQALREAEGHYDVVLALNALHHFGHLEETMRLIARALGPGGLLIIDEYVGPSRFQWASAQMRAANALLAALPDERRIQRDGRIKRRVVRPSRLSMRLDDPSEAVESSDLVPALHRRFAVLEEHPYGSILHLALHGIASNFLAGDPGTAQVMRQCLAAEDQALSRLGHDFTYAVCSPRRVPQPAQAERWPSAVPRQRPARPGYEGLAAVRRGQAQGPAEDSHLGLDRRVSGPVAAGEREQPGRRG
jgi:SAM-dependent methyltransferase